MKTFAKKIIVGATIDKNLFKRTLMSLSLMLQNNNQNYEYFKYWIINNYYSEFKDEINYVFNIDYNKNKEEYNIAIHLAKKLEKEYNKLITKKITA